MVNPAATGCPCEDGWSLAPYGPLIGWGSQPAQCVAIDTPTQKDLAATVYTDPEDLLVYPHYPIGAAYVAGDPVHSVCRLVQVDDDTTVTDLVVAPINQGQQAECAVLLTNQLCDSVSELP